MNILLVEDERRLSEPLCQLLKKQGYSVDVAEDGRTGIEMASTGVYDILVLDRMLPQLDGVSLLKEFRQMGHDTPVLFLSARDSLEDRVVGLDAGADDYLVKPFSPSELFARLRALSRRRSRSISGDLVSAGGLTLDPLKGELVSGTEVIQLTAKESLLLELLMVNHGQVIPKERIWEKVWGYNSTIETANVDLYVHYLRKKIPGNHIRTIRGIGYCFEEEARTERV